MSEERGSREVEVHCSFDEMLPAHELKPNPRNPNKHPKKQLELLKRVIEAAGWRAPVTVSRRSGCIVRGHARYLVAVSLGCDVPVDFQDYSSDEEELADLTADNRIAELADLDEDLLKDILKDLMEADFDIELTGYDEARLSRILEEEGLAGDGGELPQAIQLLPPREYVLVICREGEEGQEEFERLRLALDLKYVRRGGYKKGSPFDDVGVQRVVWAVDLLGRLGKQDE